MTGSKSKAEYDTTEYGELFTGSYPQYASIKRELITTPSGSCDERDKRCGHTIFLFFIKNLLNHYRVLAPTMLFQVVMEMVDKDSQTINLIHIPSIFYGTKNETRNC